MKKKILSLVLAGALLIVDCVPALAENDHTVSVETEAAISVSMDDEADGVADTDEVFAVNLPEGYELSDIQEAIKADGLLEGHKASDSLTRAKSGGDYVEGQVIFYADDESEAAVVAKAIGANLLSFEYGIAIIGLPDGMSTFDAVKLSENKSLSLPLMEPNWIIKVDPVVENEDEISALGKAEYVTPTDWSDYYNKDLYLLPGTAAYQWHHEMISDYAAWGITKGKGIKVAVIDSGIISTHEDLKGQIEKYKAISDGTPVLDLSSEDHGSHISGIIAAKQGNKLGGAGVAPEATLLCYKIFGTETEEKAGAKSGTIAQGCKAIAAAIEDGASVINMSLGDVWYSSLENEMVQKAVNSGVVVVCAAGNENSETINYPAGYKNVISVAAVGADGARSCFSNYGSGITLSAPGSYIWSVVDYNNTAYISAQSLDEDSEVYYDFKSGTSMACPVVSGAVALYLSVAGDKKGDVNSDGKRDIKDVNQVISALKKSCTKQELLVGGGAGVVNCYNLVAPFGGTVEKTKEPQTEIPVNETSDPAAKVTILGGKSFGTVTDKNGVAKSIQLFTKNMSNTEYDTTKAEKESEVQLATSITGKSGNKITCPVVWTSSDSKVATVSSAGLVTAKKAGKVTITATAADGSKKKASVTINVIVPVTGISIGCKDEIAFESEHKANRSKYTNPDYTTGDIEIAYGKSKKLGARVEGLYGTPTNKKIEWVLNSSVTEKYGITLKNGTLKISTNADLKALLESVGCLSLTIYAKATDGSGAYGESTIVITQPASVLAPVAVGNNAQAVISETTGKTLYIGNPGDITKDNVKKTYYMIADSDRNYPVYFYSDRKDLDLVAYGSKGNVVPQAVGYGGAYFIKNNKKYYVYVVEASFCLDGGSGNKLVKANSYVKVATTDGTKKSSTLKFVQYNKHP